MTAGASVAVGGACGLVSLDVSVKAGHAAGHRGLHRAVRRALPWTSSLAIYVVNTGGGTVRDTH